MSEEEKLLVQTSEIFEKWHLPLLRRNVIDIARSYILELGKKIDPLVKFIQWVFHSFKPHHQELKLTKCVTVEKIRSISCTTDVVSE